MSCRSLLLSFSIPHSFPRTTAGSGRVVFDFSPFAFAFAFQVGRVCRCHCGNLKAAAAMSIPIHVDDWRGAPSGYHAVAVLPGRTALASRELLVRSGVPAATTTNAVNNRTASTSSHPTSHSVPTSSVRPRPTMRAPRGPPVALITGAAVGGVIVVVAILALVYFLRVRRRVKRMKRCTNILGPGTFPAPSFPRGRATGALSRGSRIRLVARCSLVWF